MIRPLLAQVNETSSQSFTIHSFLCRGVNRDLSPPPPIRSPAPPGAPHEMILCTWVYVKLPFWVPVSSQPPLHPLILNSLYATPLYMCKEVRGQCFMYRVHRHRLFTVPIHFRTKLFVIADLVGVDLQDNFISQSYQSDSHLMTGLCLTGTSPNVITSLKVQYIVLEDPEMSWKLVLNSGLLNVDLYSLAWLAPEMIATLIRLWFLCKLYVNKIQFRSNTLGQRTLL